MHAVVRTYNGHGAVELFNMLEDRRDEIESMMRRVPGFVAYHLIRTRLGGVSVTIAEGKEGTDASVDAARDWLRENASQIRLDPPLVSEGEVMIHAVAGAWQQA